MLGYGGGASNCTESAFQGAKVAARGYRIRGMGELRWVAIPLALGVVFAVVGVWRRSAKGGWAVLDVGSVSEGWLAQQRGRKDS
jgi:hypothetical protein